jgi:hypothetical protein
LVPVHPTAGERLEAVLASAFGEAEAAFRAGLRRITLDHLAERLAAMMR